MHCNVWHNKMYLVQIYASILDLHTCTCVIYTKLIELSYKNAALQYLLTV